MKILVYLCILIGLVNSLDAGMWTPDLGNGRYKNPILFADYSDPDIIKVKNDFYMVASSFNCMPGIPILHSYDLVNWTIINHVYDRLPFEKYDKPVHGEGSWAPSIRFHNGKYYVYFCTPQDGLFMASTEDVRGHWDLHQVVSVEMWEDPCPIWDDDGNAYLVHSKLCGTELYLHKMSPDGKKLLDNGKLIFKNVENQNTIEGPKFLKKDGYYYILAPAGGVSTGWQSVLRSKNIYGPYEDKVVMQQGSTDINGPHQGGIVELESGEWWFVHFQSRGAYGRIIHLQPAKWIDGFPYIGSLEGGKKIGEPVAEYKKPDAGGKYPIAIPQTSDSFESNKLGLQWQWHANPKKEWYSLTERKGFLRLNCVQNISQNGNLWFVPNQLLQKFPAPVFTATTKVEFHPEFVNERCGLVVMGRSWAGLSLDNTAEGVRLTMFTGTFQTCDDQTSKIKTVTIDGNAPVYLKVSVSEGAVCSFSFSQNGIDYTGIGEKFNAKEGVWIGAKVGLFSINPNIEKSRGYADFENFVVE
jgi:beta-xylosidase